jgi:hypothetical protein
MSCTKLYRFTNLFHKIKISLWTNIREAVDLASFFMIITKKLSDRDEATVAVWCGSGLSVPWADGPKHRPADATGCCAVATLVAWRVGVGNDPSDGSSNK